MAKKKGFIDQLVDISKRKSNSVLIPSAFLVAAVLGAVPAPTDIGYFYAERWLQGKENEQNYWLYKALNYYGWDVIWYTTLFGVTYTTGKTVSDKIVAGAGVLSLGAIVYMLWKFTTKPVEFDRIG